MSDTEQQKRETLRNNEARCIRILAACRRYAVHLSGAAGNYATFGQNEEILLRSFQEVVEAHESSDGRYNELFIQRYQKAGLTPTDVQRLSDEAEKMQYQD